LTIFFSSRFFDLLSGMKDAERKKTARKDSRAVSDLMALLNEF